MKKTNVFLYVAAIVLMMGIFALPGEKIPEDVLAAPVKKSNTQTDLSGQWQIKNPTASKLVYGQSLKESALTGGELLERQEDGSYIRVSGSFQWLDPSVVPNPGSSYQSVKFVPAAGTAEIGGEEAGGSTDTLQTQSGSQTESTAADTTAAASEQESYPVFYVNVDVEKAIPEVTWPVPQETITYGTSLKDITWQKNGSAAYLDQKVEGKFYWKEESTIPKAGTQKAVCVFQPVEISLYQTVEQEISFHVQPLEPSIEIQTDDSSLIEGESLKVTALLHKNGAVAFQGKIQFQADGQTFYETHINGSESAAQSFQQTVSWEGAAAGTHTLQVSYISDLEDISSVSAKTTVLVEEKPEVTTPPTEDGDSESGTDPDEDKEPENPGGSGDGDTDTDGEGNQPEVISIDWPGNGELTAQYGDALSEIDLSKVEVEGGDFSFADENYILKDTGTVSVTLRFLPDETRLSDQIYEKEIEITVVPRLVSVDFEFVKPDGKLTKAAAQTGDRDFSAEYDGGVYECRAIIGNVLEEDKDKITFLAEGKTRESNAGTYSLEVTGIEDREGSSEKIAANYKLPDKEETRKQWTILKKELELKLETDRKQVTEKEKVRLTASVENAVSGKIPEGTLIFRNGDKQIGTAHFEEKDGKVTAVCESNALGAGNHSLTVSYEPTKTDNYEITGKPEVIVEAKAQASSGNKDDDKKDEDKNNDDKNSGGSSQNTPQDHVKTKEEVEQEFWQDILFRIYKANDTKSIVTINMGKRTSMPDSIMYALRNHPDATLAIVWEGGDMIIIPGSKAMANTDGRDRWNFSDLTKLYPLPKVPALPTIPVAPQPGQGNTSTPTPSLPVTVTPPGSSGSNQTSTGQSSDENKDSGGGIIINTVETEEETQTQETASESVAEETETETETSNSTFEKNEEKKNDLFLIAVCVLAGLGMTAVVLGATALIMKKK